MASRQRTNGNAPALGDLIEQWVTEKFCYEYADDTFFDHVTEKGTCIQVKGAQKWIKNGYYNGNQQWTRGRFKLWRQDHIDLKEDGGVYLLSVYEEDCDGDPETVDDITILGWQIVDPETVERAIPEWWEVSNIRADTKGPLRRVSWADLFEKSGVDDGSRR